MLAVSIGPPMLLNPLQQTACPDAHGGPTGCIAHGEQTKLETSPGQVLTAYVLVSGESKLNYDIQWTLKKFPHP